MTDNRQQVFRYCPRCGKEGFAQAGRDAFGCGACGFTYHINPAAATGAFICDPQGRVLLVRRAKDPGKGKLSLPGGFVDSRESAEDGLRREILEEVGLVVDSLHYLVSFPNVYPYREVVYDTLDLFFVATVRSLNTAHAREEVAGLVIIQVADINEEEFAFESVKKAAAVFKSWWPASRPKLHW
jgi:ADP-ribose pyrophosphatase YjhB (NUDIX family)